MYEGIRIAIEVISASLCFILLWFMAKPYILTRESRYLGLPLGFGFLGTSSIILAIALSIPNFFTNELAWLQLLPRTFAFLFLAVTYYFSKKPSRRSPLIWDVTISFLILVLVTSVMMVIINPQLPSPSYLGVSVYFRVFNLLCLFYISVYALRSHIRNLEPSTIVIPLGFILFGMQQYSVLIWSVDRSYFAFWGALALRLAALVVFLFVSYQVFYSSNKGGKK
jgi:hypothetical protein